MELLFVKFSCRTIHKFPRNYFSLLHGCEESQYQSQLRESLVGLRSVKYNVHCMVSHLSKTI